MILHLTCDTPFEFLRLRLWFLIFKAWLLLSRLRTQRCTSSRLEPRTQCFRGTRSHCSVLQCVAVHIASEKWGRGSLPKGQVERQRATWCIHTSKITHAHAWHDSCTRSHTKHYSTRVYSLRTHLLGPHAILHIHQTQTYWRSTKPLCSIKKTLYWIKRALHSIKIDLYSAYWAGDPCKPGTNPTVHLHSKESHLPSTEPCNRSKEPYIRFKRTPTFNHKSSIFHQKSHIIDQKSLAFDSKEPLHSTTRALYSMKRALYSAHYARDPCKPGTNPFTHLHSKEP